MDIIMKTRNLMSGETSKIQTDYVAKTSMEKPLGIMIENVMFRSLV